MSRRHRGIRGIHCCKSKIARRNVVDGRGGNIGIEIRLGVNYTEAVVRRGMALEDFAAVTSTNAAKLLGLYPRKGAIAVSSDADITIIDLAVKKTLTMADLHLRDYSPWEGWQVEGWPTTVILRGRVLVENSLYVDCALYEGRPTAYPRPWRSGATSAVTGKGEDSMNDPQELTLEELRARIRAAGVTSAAHRLAMVRQLLGDALAPLRRLDTRAIKTLEPAVTFAPAHEARHE